MTDDFQDIRDAVAKLCADFPGKYWQELDRARAYPDAFVTALTEAGYLAALIPEELGGAGLPLSAATAILEEHTAPIRPSTRMARTRKSSNICPASPPARCDFRPSGLPNQPAEPTRPR